MGFLILPAVVSDIRGWNAAGGWRDSPAIGWPPTLLVPMASDSKHPRLRLQLPVGVPPTNKNIIASIVFAVARVLDRAWEGNDDVVIVT